MSFTVRIMLTDGINRSVYLDQSVTSTGDYKTIPGLLDEAHTTVARYLGAVGAYSVVNGFAFGSPQDGGA